MTEEAVARLRRLPPGAPAVSGEGTPALPPEADEETAESVPVASGRTEGWALARLERGGKARVDRLPPRLLTLGSAADCDLPVSGPEVAPQHARLRYAGGGYVVESQGATAVAVNDRRMARAPLAPYDLLQLGGALLLVLPDHGRQPAPQATGSFIEGQPVARLTHTAGPRQGDAFLLGARPVVVGRHAFANVRLDDPAVSDFHCHIAVTEGGPRVLDLRSAGGTRVNGVAVAHHLLKSGDVITVGGFTLGVRMLRPTVALESPAVAPVPTPAAPAPSPAEEDFALPNESEAEVELSTDMKIRKQLLGADNPTLRRPAPRTYRPGQLVLNCIEGPLESRKFPLGRRVNLIGREPETDIAILDTSVSRRHAEVVFETDRAEVRDLGSRNGIYVNGTRQNAAALRPGDTLRVGKCLFIIEEAAAKPAVPAPRSGPGR